MHLELSYDPLKSLISARTHVSSQSWGNSHFPELSWTVSLWIWLHVIGQPVSWGHKVRGNSEPGTIFARKVVLLFSCSVVSDSLQPHELQHARVPCPSLSSRVCSNSCPLSGWCHPTISSSAALFSCLQYFPASGSFPTSRLFASCGKSIGDSTSAHPSNEYSGLNSFRIDWFDLLAAHGTLHQHHSSKTSMLGR